MMVYSVESGEIIQATDGLADVTSVCWSTDGKCLYYTASSYSFGPEMSGLDMSTLERPVLRSIYVTVLSNGERLPAFLAPLSDDEKATEEAKDEDDGDKEKDGEKDETEEGVTVKIDADGLWDRTAVVRISIEMPFFFLNFRLKMQKEQRIAPEKR